MLFSIKRHLIPTLVLLAIFVGVALGARELFDLAWRLDFYDGFFAHFFICLAPVLIIDFGSHGLLWRFAPSFYRPRYRALVEHFRGQGIVHFIASGLLAAGEEMVFRGVLLQGLRGTLTDVGALGVSAVAFGIAHVPRPRELRFYGVLALLEGVILGVVYLYTESLLLVMIFHGLKDVGGYAFFAVERRWGVWLRSERGGAALACARMTPCSILEGPSRHQFIRSRSASV